ncbi:hypothetical protein [Salinimicrobium sp. HB62]|uniref:hypothetical protein n=1 Tax=Salinimicrobium sp. HB62 TaxID=3077781 RepID=UPI002D76DC91|nr:hypothetical protein [Salinimicrobium sp. HB62]
MFQASEPGKDYISEQKTKLLEEFNISPEQEEELIRRYRDYLEGKTEGDRWEDVRQNIKDLYGF